MKAELTNAELSPRDAARVVRPRTTLHVIADMSADHGGSVRVVADLCQAFNKWGIQCEIASLRRRATSSGVAGGDAVFSALRLFRSAPPRRLGNSVEFALWLAKNVNNYELIEIHEVFRLTSLIAARIAHRNNVPYLIHPHGSLDPFDLRKHHLAKRTLAPLFRNLLLKHARGIVFTSAREQREADTFSARTPRYRVPPVILHNAVNGERGRLRTSLNISDDTFLLLFMSRIDYKKGLLRTLRAVRAAADGFARVRLVIAGSGDPSYERLVRTEVARLRLEDVVHFVGFLQGQAKADALAAADALILVSDNENFGIIVVEALRAGLPVIISDRVAVAGELERTGAAKVVPPDDEATATALCEAAGLTSAVRIQWSQAAARVADRLYDCDSVVRAQLALRRRVTGGADQQPPDPRGAKDRQRVEAGV